MKIFKLTYGLIAATMLSLASCVNNDMPEFNDADAFIAIQQTTASGAETSEKLEVPVMLTSLAGLEGTVDFVITPDSLKGAVEGKHYTIANESHTLSFTKDEPVQKIVINIIDNDIFEGDVKFNIELTNVQGVKLGANSKCEVTLVDDEHPLAFILGTFTAKGESYFSGDAEWEVTIEKDAEDINKIWIDKFVQNGSNLKIYATVNEDKTEIHIPVEQPIGATDGETFANFEGFYGDHSAFGIDDEYTEDGEQSIDSGGYVTGIIAEDGTITIIDWIGSEAVDSGWYNIFHSGVVLKKQ